MQWNAQEWISGCAIIAAQIRKLPPMRVICIVSKREKVGPSEPTKDLQKCKKSSRPAAPANNRHETQSASATPLNGCAVPLLQLDLSLTACEYGSAHANRRYGAISTMQ